MRATAASTPRRAVVLAAGFGTRMHPLTRVVPKPLLPLWGVPVLERVLRMLRSWGVRHVLVNLHHGSHAVLDYLRNRPGDRLQIDLSFEPDLLGTGGALRRAAWFLDRRPFWMVNADIAAALNPQPLVRALRRRDTLAALWLHPRRGPRTVDMRDGEITCFRSATPGAEHTYTFCGLHLLRPAVVDLLPDGFSSVIAAYERARREGQRIAGVVIPDAYWRDVGRPEDYLAAHEERKPRRHGHRTDPSSIEVKGFAALDDGATVEAGARIERSVIWRGARLGPRARVRNAVVASGVVLHGEAEHLVMQASDVLQPGETAILAPLGWTGDRVAAECLPPRGSDRLFFRLHRGRRTAMLVRYDTARPENRLYAGHARFLDALGVRVPRVLADAPRQGFTLFEDLGRLTLERCIENGAGPRRVQALYRRVLEMMHRMHGEGARAARRRRLRLMPGFTPALYRWERTYFAEHFLAGVLGFGPARTQAITSDLQRVARHLAGAERALLHRDLQSGNILVTARTVGLIDFQGMRFGPAAYDLASLLCDPYVMPSPALRRALLAFYGGLDAAAGRAVEYFPWAALQRLAQALGAYGRLAGLPGGEGYRRHMPRAVRMMRTALAELPQTLPALAEGLDAARARFSGDPGKAG